MCIVSNCLFKNRVKSLSQKSGIPAFFRAVKPSSKGFLQAIDFLKSDLSKTVIIGDQIFTDILGGNRLGIFTILVKPIEPSEYFTTFFQRLGEKVVMIFFNKQKK
jgi:HAD superfamily phosphatase (TIGR01668 family)